MCVRLSRSQEGRRYQIGLEGTLGTPPIFQFCMRTPLCHWRCLSTERSMVQTEDPACGGLFLWDWFTPTAVTSTVTQTMDDGRSLHQWRSIQEQCWVELQKVPHTIQSTLNKHRDPGRTPSAHSPTAMSEQMKERIHTIAQDMHILNRSCGEELVRSSMTRARRSATNQRKSFRPVKRACSETIWETISSIDGAVARRKRARFYKGSSPCHTHQDRHLPLHNTIFHSHDSSSHGTVHHERGTVHCSVTHSLRLKTDNSHESGQPSPAPALQNNLGHCGALEFVSERRKIQDPPHTTGTGR